MSRSPRSDSTHRIHELDGLRFMAIAGVLLVHYRPPFRPGLDAFAIGWAGVDLFFVISGFLITGNLMSLRGTGRPYRVFYWRRALRIFPPYYVVVLAVALLCELQYHFIVKRLVVLLSFFLTSLYLYPAPIHYPLPAIMAALHQGIHANQIMPLDHHVLNNYEQGLLLLWSLSIEELFYLIWAPVVLKGSRFVIAAVSFSAVIVCPALRMVCHVPGYNEYFFLPTRFDALTFGSLLALLLGAYNRQKKDLGALKKFFASAASISASLLFLLSWHDGLLAHLEVRSALSFAVFGYSLLGILFTAVVGLCIVEKDRPKWWAKLLRARPLTYIGEVSYVIYLTHIPVYIALAALQGRMLGHEVQPTLWLGLTSAAATLGLASLSWRFFERPLLRFRNVVQ